jgi:hypothetical protein
VKTMSATDRSDHAGKIEALKRNVAAMIRERQTILRAEDPANPSPLWLECLQVFSYMLSLSPEDYRNVRVHTGLITGSSPFLYWHPDPPIDPEAFVAASAYPFHCQGVPEDRWLSEPLAPGIPGPLGVHWRGRVLNGDVIRYQSCVSVLQTMGILDELRGRSSRSLVMEIGGGFGGLAHGLGGILGGQSTYVVLDLAEMLLFSGGYLITNHPDKKIYVYDPETFTPEFLRAQIHEYDYVLLPNYLLPRLSALPRLDLMINMQSFQEMTPAQIRAYLALAEEKLDGFLYSDNVDRHPHNADLQDTTISRELGERFLMLPPPSFYDARPRSKSPWYYRSYLCLPRGQRQRLERLPATAVMRVCPGGEPLTLEFGGIS